MSEINISRIIFKDVKENNQYGYGMYGDFKVIIMKENGFINATKLCDLDGKQFCHQLQNESCKKLIETAKKSIKDKTGEDIEVIIKINNTINKLRGTYVHQKLIVHIASWVSSDFAMQVSDIVDNYMVAKYEGKLIEKDNIISQLNITLTQMEKNSEERHNKLLGKISTLKLQNNEIKQQNDELLFNVSNLENQNIEIQDILAKSLKDRVPKTKSSSKDEYLAVIRKNNKDKSYYVIRRQRNSIKATIYKYMAENPGSRLIYLTWNPNSVNNYVRLKEKKYISKILTNYNYLTLLGDTTEHDLKKILYEVNNEKYNTQSQRELNEYIDKFIQDMVVPKSINYDDDEDNNDSENNDSEHDVKEYSDDE